MPRFLFLKIIITISFISQDQAKFNEEYKKLEHTHTKVKNEAEVLEKEIEYKTAWKNKLMCVIKAYK